MSDGVNKVFLLGNLGQDPELRHTQGGQAVMTLRLATNESYYNKQSNERESKTEWHTVVIWGKRAEALERYLQRGSRLHVEGRLQTRTWEDKAGGKRYATEIVASEITLLGDSNGPRQSSPAPRREPQQQPMDDDDDIPF